MESLGSFQRDKEMKPVVFLYWFHLKKITSLDFEPAFHLMKARLRELEAGHNIPNNHLGI